MQNQGDFKLCASSTDVVKRFAVIKSVVIKRIHCTCFIAFYSRHLQVFGGEFCQIILLFTKVSKVLVHNQDYVKFMECLGPSTA